MTYRTINYYFTVYDNEALLILQMCARYKAGVYKVLKEVQQVENWESKFTSIQKFKSGKYYRIAKSIVNHAHYAQSVCEQVFEIGKSLKELRKFYKMRLRQELDISIKEIDLRDWVMFESRGDERVNGNHNIKIKEVHENSIIFNVRVYNHLNQENWISIKCGIPKGRKWKLLTDIVYQLCQEKKLEYGARVYIDDASWDGAVAKGKVQIWIPLNIRLLVEQGLNYTLQDVNSILGIDHNFDRTSFVLIDFDENILHMETLDLTKFVTQGRNAKDLDTYFIKWFRKFVTKLWLNGYRPFVVTEDPDVLGYLKIKWMIKGKKLHEAYNYVVSRFDIKVLELIHDTCEKLRIPHDHVDPRGTTHSREHEKVMKRLGLDRHMASAYLIAKRGLEKLKQII